MREQRSNLAMRSLGKASFVLLLVLLPVLLVLPQPAKASKSTVPAKTDNQKQDKTSGDHHKKRAADEPEDEHRGPRSDDDSYDGHHGKRGEDNSEDGHHRRRHGNGERHHSRRGNWGDKDETRDGHRRKLHSLDDDYKMEQIWKLPGLSDKQRVKLVDIEKRFYAEVRPMRKQYKGIRQELDTTNLQVTGDAGAEIGGAVMSGSAKFVADKRRDINKSIEKRGPDKASTVSKRGTSEKTNTEQKKWYHSDQLEDDKGEEPSYKAARNSALFNRMKQLRRKMKALKEKSWVEIRTVLTNKQKAILAKQ